MSTLLPTYTTTNHGSQYGHLNPSDVKSVKKLICLDSCFRENYHSTESSDFTVTLPEPINNVTSLKLSSMELPNMWYMFSSHNLSNVFYITISDLSGDYVTETFTIQIPDGNYLVTYFQDTLNSILRGKGQGLEYIHVSVDNFTGRVVFRSKNEAVDSELTPYDNNQQGFRYRIQFKVDGVPYNQTAGWMMGFKDEFYEVGYNDTYVDYRNIIDSDVTTFEDNGDLEVSSINPDSILFPIYRAYLESESAFGTNISQYLFFDVDDFQKNHSPHSIMQVQDGRFIGQNVLGKIVITSGQFTNIIDNGSDMIFKKRNYFGPVRLEKLRLRILDKFGNRINLQNNDYSCSLEIEQIYSR